MELTSAINSIFSGNAILIVGSGFSLGALNKANKPVPGVDELISKLLDLIPEVSVENFDRESITKEQLPDIAEYVIEDLNKKEEVMELIRSQYNVNFCTNFQREISNLNWYGIYTTNYDNLIETASKNFRTTVIPAKNDFSRSDVAPVMHLNGDLTNLNRSSFKENLKLTLSSYGTSEQFSSTFREFHDDIFSAQAIFIIGLSFDSDLDIKRTLLESDKTRQKTFIVNGEIDENTFGKKLKNKALSKVGKITGLTGEKFSKLVIKQKEEWKTTSEQRSQKKYYSAFEEIKFNSDQVNKKARATDAEDLLIYGKQVNLKYIDDPNYCVQRVFDDELSLDKNGAITIITSKLGNGKTIFMKQLARYIAKQNKRRVFWFTGDDTNFQKNLNDINNSPEEVTIFIDDYYTILPKLSSLSHLSTDKIQFFFSGRTSIVNENDNDLRRKINRHDNNRTNFLISRLSIDELKSSSLEEFKRIIDRHNLITKKQYRKNIYQSASKKRDSKQFYFLISDLLKSSSIARRYEDYIGTLVAGSNEFNIITFILVMNVIGLNVDLHIIQEIFKVWTFPVDFPKDRDLNKKRVQFKDFVDLKNDSILMNSAIVSKYLLKRFDNKQHEGIISTLINAMKQLDKMIGNTKKEDKNNMRETIAKSLVSFSNYQLIMKTGYAENQEEHFKLQASNYYEDISHLNFTKENEFFYLQYAIQRMDNKRWSLAKVLLDKSIELEKAKNFRDECQFYTQMIRLYIDAPTSEISDVKSPENRISSIETFISKALPNNEMFCIKQLENLPKRIPSYFAEAAGLSEEAEVQLTYKLEKLLLNLKKYQVGQKYQPRYKKLIVELTEQVEESIS